MYSPNSSPPLICANCEGAIAGRAEFHVGLPFCCAGCVIGGPCSCSYDLIEEAEAVLEVARTSPELVPSEIVRA